MLLWSSITEFGEEEEKNEAEKEGENGSFTTWLHTPDTNAIFPSLWEL